MRIKPEELLSFRTMITPVVIQFIFWIGAGLALLLGLGTAAAGIFTGSVGMIFGGLIYAVLGPIFVRVWCELIVVIFNIHDDLRIIRAATAPSAPPAPPAE